MAALRLITNRVISNSVRIKQIFNTNFFSMQKMRLRSFERDVLEKIDLST